MRNLTIACVLLAVSLTIFGCSRTAAPSETNANAAAPAEEPVRAVDIAALVGKPFGEIEKELGPPADTSGDMLTWRYPQGELTVRQDSYDKKKVAYFTFTTKTVVVGDKTGTGFAKYEQLGDLVGIDVRDKPPTKADEGETGAVEFADYDLNGKAVPIIRFNKVLGKFDTVWVYPSKH
jgi:hypothetical protein